MRLIHKGAIDEGSVQNLATRLESAPVI